MNRTVASSIVMILACAAHSGASSALEPVRIEHHATPALGEFTATGAIEDEGLATRDEALFAAIGSPTVGAGQFVYTFHGQLGSLTVRLQWLLTATEVPSIGHVDGRWVVISGTGAYAGLRGQGDYVATLDFLAMTRDAVFTGRLHCAEGRLAGLKIT